MPGKLFFVLIRFACVAASPYFDRLRIIVSLENVKSQVVDCACRLASFGVKSEKHWRFARSYSLCDNTIRLIGGKNVPVRDRTLLFH